MVVLNSHFLVGLAGAAIPILIHFLTRDRVQKVAFPTLRFFAKTSRRVLRRKKLLELILLAMRTLACALLALAFARPLLRASVGGEIATAGTAKVIVADVSASMRRAGLGDTLRAEAKKALLGLSEGSDAVALIALAEKPRLVLPLTRRLAAVKAQIDVLTPGHGGTDLAEAVRQAGVILDRVSARTKEVVLISDLQRTGWQRFAGGWRLPAGVKLTVRPTRLEGSTENRAVVEAHYPHSMVVDQAAQPLAVRVANFSTAACRDVKVTCSRDDKEIESQSINLRAGGSAAVRFRSVFDSPGDNPVTITVDSVDAVPGDNVFYLNVRVIPRIKVLILNGRPSPSPEKDAAFFLEKALAPVEESPFEVKSVDASQAKESDLEAVRVAILSNVREVSANVVEALEALLARGGGLLFVPGNRCDPKKFREVFGQLAPCKLRKPTDVRQARGGPRELVLTKIDYTHPIFEVFLRPHHGDFSTVRFMKFWEVTDSQLSRVLARFSNGRSAILERQIGTGVSMMLATACDLEWNDLALRAIFLPYLHQTVRYLAVRTEPETAFVVGDRLPVSSKQRLEGPDGKRMKGEDVVAEKPGFYLASGGGQEDFCFAVNRDPREADPATVSAEEIVTALQRSPGEAVEDAKASAKMAIGAVKDEGNIWWYLMAAIPLLLLVELVVANHAVRH